MIRNIIRSCILCSVFVYSAYSNIINIPDDYPTIQQGIDVGSDGDTVLVQPGTYMENINFNGHNIVLGSMFLTTGDTSYIATTIIDGDSLETVVVFENGEDTTAILCGFTVKNGHAHNGGGIICKVNSDPYIANNVLCNNIGLSSGGGIYINNSDPRIVGNTISDNWSPGVEVGTGGGIYCINSNSIISGNIISGNGATGSLGSGAGGGIFCIYSDLAIVNNSITGNFAGSQGGGIHIFDSAVLALANEINGNTALYGGGVFLFESDSVNLIGNRISSNNATSGGGIYFPYSNLTLSHNIIDNNDAGEFGGGICCEYSGPRIINNVLYENSAQFGGGIFTMYTSYPTITNTIFWADSAALGGDEIGGDDASWPTIRYCDIEGIVWPGEGNIDADPLFRNPDNGDFHPMSIACGDSADSPCMDAGDPAILDSLLDCSWGLGGPRSDIGAYGGGDLSGLCSYVVGDANNGGAFDGLDITYGVFYFKGGPPPPYECECTPGNIWYVAGDVNASCNYNGLDITFGVAYFKGGPDPVPCVDCPPVEFSLRRYK